METEDNQKQSNGGQGREDRITVGEATQILVYQDAAIPASDRTFAVANSQSQFIQRLPEGSWTIGNGPGPVTQETRQEREERKQQEDLDAMRGELEAFQDYLKEERQHQEWLAESHSYAGQHLTGAEWRSMMDWFKGDKNVADWERAMMAQTGMSLTEVRHTGGKMKRFYELMDKDSRGTLTAQEKTEFTTLNNDKDVHRGVEVEHQLMDADWGKANKAEVQAVAAESKADSTTSRNSLIAARADFNAEPLKPAFNPAARGDAPRLKAELVTTQAPAPVKVAAMTADLDMG